MRWPNIPEIERFWLNVMPEPNSGCWLWTAGNAGSGYGYFRTPSGSRAHRYSYTYYKGPIPDGLELDHLCRVRCCVNPDHLEAVTRRVNIARGISQCAINMTKTHCKHGHQLSDDNVYIKTKKSGGKERVCRICRRLSVQKAERRRKLKHLGPQPTGGEIASAIHALCESDTRHLDKCSWPDCLCEQRGDWPPGRAAPTRDELIAAAHAFGTGVASKLDAERSVDALIKAGLISVGSG